MSWLRIVSATCSRANATSRFGHNAQTFQANLDPFQEVPPHNTPGFGSADATLTGGVFSIVASTGIYADLLAGATAVTLNDAAVGVNGPVISVLTLDTPGCDEWHLKREAHVDFRPDHGHARRQHLHQYSRFRVSQRRDSRATSRHPRSEQRCLAGPRRSWHSGCRVAPPQTGSLIE